MKVNRNFHISVNVSPSFTHLPFFLLMRLLIRSLLYSDFCVKLPCVGIHDAWAMCSDIGSIAYSGGNGTGPRLMHAPLCLRWCGVRASCPAALSLPALVPLNSLVVGRIHFEAPLPSNTLAGRDLVPVLGYDFLNLHTLHQLLLSCLPRPQVLTI